MQNSELKHLADQLEQRRVKAMVKGDIAELRALISDDLYYGHAGGYVDNKASFLKKIDDEAYTYQSIKTKVEQVTAIGETGMMINGELAIEVKHSGENKVFKAIYLAIWRLEGDTWRFLSLQAAIKKRSK